MTAPPSALETTASGRVHLFGPRVAATTLLPSADFCAPIGLPLGSPRTRQARRSPRVRRVTFLPYPPHIHRAVPDDRGLRTPTRPRPTARCLTCDSCASGQNFAFSFLQIPPHDGHPCCSARSSCHQGLQGTCTLTSLPGRLSPSGCSARQGAARHAWRTSGRPGSLLTLAPHRSGRAGSAASGSSTDSFAPRRRVPAGPGSQAMATAIPTACLASAAIRCRDVETGPNLGVLAVFPSNGATCRCPLPSTGSRGLNAPTSAVL